MTLPALERRVVVCVGCGGVGKTTVAAAIGLEAARAGRRALVITIDPARRLADALGVETLGNQPEPLPREKLTALGVPPEGSLSALMLDMKRTFDDLVARFAESDSARARVLENPIYRHVSDALAGSVEYSAMEKVYELSRSHDYDTLVVDTPPAQHALDFLDAPERLLEFLDSRLVKILIHPAMVAGRLGTRWFEWGTRHAFALIERITGLGFLSDVSEFLMAFEHMSEGFRTRAREVRSLLLGPQAAFVLIASPESESVKQAQGFLARLEASNVRVAGIVANRVRTWPDAASPTPPALDAADPAPLTRALAVQASRSEPQASEDQQWVGAEFPAERAARAAIDAAARYAALVRRDARALDALREQASRRGSFFRVVPEQRGDVHDLSGLLQVAAALAQAGEAEPIAGEKGEPMVASRGGRRGRS
jgi:anion-transporting  ArsA/GET3 family ATPase